MMNWIWLGLVVIGVIAAAFSGSMDAVTKAAFDAAKTAVELCIGLIGIMALWLGMMRVAEEAGLVQLLAKAVRPVMRKLFPDVPPDHPAMGSMLANIAANLLGLGNSATALGLKAMQDLQSLNKGSDTASNAMVIFMAINATAITLVPATVIGLRVAAGSAHPTSIIGTTLISCCTAAIVAVTSAKLLQRTKFYRGEKSHE
jgi:spore maturation protein A